MARKTKDDAQLTCTALLDAAERVFFDNGVASTTLAEIASAAGLTRGAIYWHFKDKTDLIRALFARAMLPMEAMLKELEQGSEGDPLRSLRNMCVQALVNLSQSAEQQRVFSIMFHKCEHVGQLVAVLEDKHEKREQCLAEVRTVLDKAVSRGQLPPDTDVGMAHQAINNFMTGTMSEWLFTPQAFALETCAPAMVEMLLAGLQACPPRLPPDAGRGVKARL
jgi:TetR/AcrR family transcriptional regulator, acrAB operon repressor